MNFLETSSSWTLALLLITLALISSFFSGMEAAYLSLTRVSKKRLQKKKSLFAFLSHTFLKHFDVFITSILLINLFNNILATLTAKTLAARWMAIYYPDFNLEGLIGSLLFILCFTFLFIIFCEVAPKRISLHYAEGLVYWGSLMMAPVYFLFYPISYIFSHLAKRFISVFISSTATSNQVLEKKTFVNYLKMSSDAGVLKQVETQVLENFITYKNTPIKILLIPRQSMEGFNIQTLPDGQKLMLMIKKFKHNAIPVYDGLKDHLIGVLSKRKMAFNKHKDKISCKNLKKYLDKPMFVPEAKSIVDVLADLNAHDEEIAIVTDEHGGIEGIATYSDIVEQIFGKKDVPLSEISIQKIGVNVYLVNPQTTLDVINRHFQVSLQCDAIDTIGGYVLEGFREIPKSGRVYRDRIFEYTVKKASKTSIKQLMLKRLY